MLKKKYDIVISIAFSSFGLLLALAALEITLRISSNDLTKQAVALNDRPKNYYTPADSANLQDYKVLKPKPKNTFRIAAVGDSFTFGPYLQFDDAYPKRLERWLNLNRTRAIPEQDNPVNIEVINYGVPRFSTFHEVGAVKQALVEGADLILLQITLNDPEQKLYWPTELIPDEAGEIGAVSSNSWFGNLRIVKFVRQRLNNTRSQRLYRDYFFKLFERDTADYEKFLNAFTEIRKLTERHKKPLIAVVFPLFGVEVGDKYPFWSLHEQLRNDLTGRAIPFFDISAAFRGLPVERLQVLPGFDRHPNEIAHRIAAEQILEELHTRGLLPAGVYPTRIEPRRIGINRAASAASDQPDLGADSP